tara:strand:- start:49 stop:834 length:786 start_codon:yes stop_codon:yes gene_type:complete
MPKKNDTNCKLTIRGDKNLAEEIHNKNIDEKFIIDNPIKHQIKIHQFPWTEKQKEFFKIALHPGTRVVFVNGPAGTSKTLLSAYCGLQLLNMKVISDIMYLRSAVESADRSLGFLPGSADDKLKFFNLPLLDKLDELLSGSKPEKLIEDNRISMFPVNFARGMNWHGKCIILDEAQNSTIKEITTVLTRMGKNSRCFILADPMQTDLKSESTQGGFVDMMRVFSDEESLQHGVHTFNFTEDDIMRSELIKFLIRKIKKIDR